MRPAALFVALQRRGFTLEATADGRLELVPASRLTDEERAAIREHVRELVRLARGGLIARRELELAEAMSRAFAPDGTRLCECGEAAIRDGRGLCAACASSAGTSAA